eukprot:UC1_evm1s182
MSQTYQVLESAGQNRHRFLSFRQQLERVDLGAVRRIGSVLEDVPETGTTFMAEGLDKWSELNCTTAYVAFTDELRGCVDTLPLLIHHQLELVDTFIRHLVPATAPAHEPILDLLVQLARDLRKEFYPHFSRVFAALVALVSPSDGSDVSSDLLKHGFTALAFLFKFLRPQLVADLPSVWRLFHPLLGPDHRDFVRGFAAEAYGFLLRKVPKGTLAKHLALMAGSLGYGSDKNIVAANDSANDTATSAAATVSTNSNLLVASIELQDGVAAILVETVRHVRYMLHSRTGEVLGAWLEIVRKALKAAAAAAAAADSNDPDAGAVDCDTAAAAAEQAASTLSYVSKRIVADLAEHVRADSAAPLWSVLVPLLEEGISAYSKRASRGRRANVAHMAELVRQFVACRRGSRLLADESTKMSYSATIEEQGLGSRAMQEQEGSVARLLQLS